MANRTSVLLLQRLFKVKLASIAFKVNCASSRSISLPARLGCCVEVIRHVATKVRWIIQVHFLTAARTASRSNVFGLPYQGILTCGLLFRQWTHGQRHCHFSWSSSIRQSACQVAAFWSTAAAGISCISDVWTSLLPCMTQWSAPLFGLLSRVETSLVGV